MLQDSILPNKRRIALRSVDKLITEKPVAKYVETSVADGQNEDFKITAHVVNRNQNLTENLRLGAYATQRYYFDFHKFSLQENKKDCSKYLIT